MYQTSLFFRISCFIIAAIIAIATYNSFIKTGLDSFIEYICALILWILFLFQSFYIESFVLQTDAFTYSKDLLNFNFKRLVIPYTSIVKIERIHNFQLITRFNIKYHDRSGMLAQFSLISFSLLPYSIVRPNISIIMNEISNKSRIGIENGFL
jgi:hypothetical protein